MKLMDFAGFALKNLFSKPVTTNYPFEPAVYPERSRGHIEIDIDDCIMCGMCMRKCPSAAITVDKAKGEWSIERMGCVQCENCVNACPKKCLHIKPGYSEPSTEKTVDTFNKPVAPAPAKADASTDAPALTSGKITNDMSTCILCGLCSRACPADCITVDRDAKTWSINRDECMQCGACIDACKKFHSLSFAEDDGETGTVTFDKNSAAAPAPKAEAKAALTSGKIANDINTCILCGLCARQCPAECITVDRDAKTWSINRDECMQCGACIDACKKFHSLSFAEDDGEAGVVTMSKDGVSAPAPAPKTKPAPKKEEPKADVSLGKISTQKPVAELTYGKIANDIDSCILCGLCAKKCPVGVITVDRKDTKTWSIDRDSCIQCGCCIDACAKVKCLGYAEDDAEYGTITYKKEA